MNKKLRMILLLLVLPVLVFSISTCGSTKIKLSSKTFTEADANNGSIGNSITMTLGGLELAVPSGTLSENTHYVLLGNDLPAGLTLVITVDSSKTATISLTGYALDHQAVNSTSGINLILAGYAFAQNPDIVEHVSLSIDFTDNTSDTDGDGVFDEDDPTASGSTNNMINGTHTVGVAKVVEITAYDNTGKEAGGLVYNNDFTSDCSGGWDPPGTLCDEPPTTHDPDTSTKTNSSSGATWYSIDGYEKMATGVLIIDACSDNSCSVVDFNTARVFQMFSDGKTTHIRFFKHHERGDVPPEWDDSGWVSMSEWTSVGAGTNSSGDGLTVTDPTAISLTPGISRYFRIEIRNDGTLEGGVPNPDPWFDGYIELRSVKIFSLPLS